MGHIKGYFEGAKTFLNPKLSRAQFVLYKAILTSNKLETLTNHRSIEKNQTLLNSSGLRWNFTEPAVLEEERVVGEGRHGNPNLGQVEEVLQHWRLHAGNTISDWSQRVFHIESEGWPSWGVDRVRCSVWGGRRPWGAVWVPPPHSEAAAPVGSVHAQPFTQ